MKKFLLITTGILFILVISGCSSYDSPSSANFSASPTPSEQPTAIPSQAPAASEGPSFSGTWDTDYGNMVLTVSGNKVTGTYDKQEGRIDGTVTDNKLTGTWTRAPTRAPPDDAGDFVFTLSDDGNSFKGLWRYGYSNDPGKDYDGFWYGTRIT
jgi:hypothetical protein